MKKFKGNRSIKDIKKISERNGCWVNTESYDDGGDWIHIGYFHEMIGFCVVLFNTFNGAFFVKDEDNKTLATYKSEDLDNEEWYSEILELVYV